MAASVVNRSGSPIRLLEVDYPSASFGTGQLEAGGTFNYRFKVLGSGLAKVSWTDVQQKDHVSTGPELHEGDEGELIITLEADSATWEAKKKP